MGKIGNDRNSSVERNEWKRTHKTTKDGWEYNIKMDLIEKVWKFVEEYHLVQNMVQRRGAVNMGARFLNYKKGRKIFEYVSTVRYWRNNIFHKFNQLVICSFIY
jgi:hypothetical protein